MKSEKPNTKKKAPALPAGFVLKPALDGKQYDEQPLFRDKIDRANHILKTVGLPKNKLD